MNRLKIVICLPALAGLATVLPAAEPQFQTFDLFRSKTEGYALYRIPGMVCTVNRTVLAYCEARRTGKSDWDNIDILMRRSTDAGRSWDPPVHIAHAGARVPRNAMALAQRQGAARDQTVNNPCAIEGRLNGQLHFLYCVEYARCFYMCSRDDGRTFSNPVDITPALEKFRRWYDWRVIGTGPGHGIQLRNGRPVVPVWLSTGTGGNAHRPSVASVIYSDDNGRNWRPGEIAVPCTEEFVNPSEATLVQLRDGSVMLNVRSEAKAHRRLVTVSADGATQWSRPRFDDQLVEPICMGSLLRLSGEGWQQRSRLLFVNPANLRRAAGEAPPGTPRDRVDLTVRLSYDDGRTWPISKLIQPGIAGYADLTALPDGTIFCFYERTNSTGTGSYLTAARFNLEWLTDGRDSFAKPGP